MTTVHFTFEEQVLLGNLNFRRGKAYVIDHLTVLLKTSKDEFILALIRGLIAKLNTVDSDSFAQLAEHTRDIRG